MTLVLTEGFDELSGWALSATPPTIAGGGRNGSCARSTGSSACLLKASIPSPSDTVTVGFAFQISRLDLSMNSPGIINLYGDQGATTHISVNYILDGSLQIARAGVTGIGSTAAGVISSTTSWYYIEVQAKLHDTTGFVTLRVNGTQVAALTNVDTKNAGTGTIFDAIGFGTSSASVAAQFDDLYVMSGAGDSFLGDQTVTTLYPNGDGAVNQWLGSDGDSVANWQLVDEVPVSAADYLRSATAGQQELYALTDLTVAGAITAVQHVSYVRKTDNGTRDVKLLSRNAAGTISKSPALTPDQNTVPVPMYWTCLTDPTDGSAWTNAKINAMQTGVEVQ